MRLPHDSPFGIIEARKAVAHGPYVFHNSVTGGKFKDVKGVLLAETSRTSQDALAHVPPLCRVPNSRRPA